MDILQLKCFWAVVTTNSFTEAGELLHVSQSTISKKIRSLELELDIELFNRRGKYFSVSGKGRKIMPYFAEMIEAYDRTMLKLDEIKKSRDSDIDELRIAGVPTMAQYGVIMAVNQFAQEYQPLHIYIDEMDEDRLLLLLQSDECDLAFCSNIKLDKERFGMQHYYTEDFVAVFSSKCRFQQGGSVCFQDLKDFDFILNRRESMLYDLCVEACNIAGFNPNIIMTTSRPNIALDQVVHSSKYVYICLSHIVESIPSDRYIIREIKNSPSFDYVFAWKLGKHLTKPAKGFLEFVEGENKNRHRSIWPAL